MTDQPTNQELKICVLRARNLTECADSIIELFARLDEQAAEIERLKAGMQCCECANERSVSCDEHATSLHVKHSKQCAEVEETYKAEILRLRKLLPTECENTQQKATKNYV